MLLRSHRCFGDNETIHNREGLTSPCVNDIKSHHELCLADVLCPTETHLQGSLVAESLRLEGYGMFKRSRHLSYTNLPQMANGGGGGVAVYVKNHLQVREKTVRAQCDGP